jgi:predicted nucleotidyltransferase component of viral defense system
MKYATDHAFRTALEARIKQVQSDSAGVSRVRKRIVFERLLARLVAQASGEWVLKGGFALELRLGNVARSTKDADFEWRLDEEDAVDCSSMPRRWTSATALRSRWSAPTRRPTFRAAGSGGGSRRRLRAGSSSAR